MYDIAEQVREWQAQGRDVRIAQVIATRGFSSRDPAAAAAWVEGRPPVGSVLEGIDTAAVTTLGDGLVEISISDDEAVAAGLACGGAASVLVQPASAYPAALWNSLVARDPVCLVTSLESGATEMFTPEWMRDALGHRDRVPRLFARGTSATALLDEGGTPTAVVALWPVPTLVVVGDGLIAAALGAAAGLLGWQLRVTPDREDALPAVAELQHSDAVVVLSHDRSIDGPVLAAALAASAGYVGALGSRRTQAARRDWLTANGVAAGAQDRIHGPAGLDIDAHTPGEIAISIVAEIIAGRSRASGGALRDREGPVHVAGVQAPPPRY